MLPLPGPSSSARPGALDTMMESSTPVSALEGRSGVLLIMLLAAVAMLLGPGLLALDRLLRLFMPSLEEPPGDTSTDLPGEISAAAAAGLLLLLPLGICILGLQANAHQQKYSEQHSSITIPWAPGVRTVGGLFQRLECSRHMHQHQPSGNLAFIALRPCSLPQRELSISSAAPVLARPAHLCPLRPNTNSWQVCGNVTP